MVKKLLEEKKINARVVTVSGKTVESLYRAKRQNLCECLLCSSGVNCSTKHAVYEAECRMCDAKYIGVSNRPLSERIKEHERYTRLPTGESPIGDHYREHWLNGDPVPILSEKPSINNLLTSYSLKIIDVGTDSIDAYIREGLNIADSQPVLNDKQMNGWIK